MTGRAGVRVDGGASGCVATPLADRRAAPPLLAPPLSAPPLAAPPLAEPPPPGVSSVALPQAGRTANAAPNTQIVAKEYKVLKTKSFSEAETAWTERGLGSRQAWFGGAYEPGIVSSADTINSTGNALVSSSMAAKRIVARIRRIAPRRGKLVRSAARLSAHTTETACFAQRTWYDAPREWAHRKILAGRTALETDFAALDRHFHRRLSMVILLGAFTSAMPSV